MDEKQVDEKLRHLASFDSKNPFAENEKLINDIVSALDRCKILDPACGSGAFPMGVLQKMVHILQKLDPDNSIWKEVQTQKAQEETSKVFKSIDDRAEREEKLKEINNAFDQRVNDPDYARKLYLIENCIYGVDIQPIATQIAKLRFFISLVVDQKSNSNADENFGIHPLPNLETKFVTANTLIGIDKPNVQYSLYDIKEVKELESELKKVRHKLFNARTKDTKLKYRQRDEELRNAIASELEKSGWKSYNAEKLAKWDPYDQHASSSFFDSEWMFDIADGFDIVIGNPPYVQLQKSGGTLAKQYEKVKYKTFERTGDIYSLFYEKGIELLKPKGILCFITSNKWMRAGYGESTRKFFVENINPLILIDFAGQKIFDSATVDTNILLLSKEKNHHKTLACVVKENVLNNLSVFVNQVGTECNFTTKDSWTILSPIEQSIKKKIEKVGTPLKDWNINIYRGILTGYNKAFIIDGITKDKLINEDAKSAEIIRPILRGRDIKRYGYNFSDLWLINSHNGIKEKGIKPININDYPAVKQHLDKYFPQLENRQDKGDTPYNLRNCAYMEDFNRHKIAWASVGETFYSCVDPGLFLLDTNYFFSADSPEYLLGILNSKLITYWINSEDTPIGSGGAYRHYKYNLERLPIPRNEKSVIVKLVKKLLDKIDKNVLREIDLIVYSLYGLTEIEIDFIENMNI
jgi:adenine-specific DNA-methyltransferase